MAERLAAWHRREQFDRYEELQLLCAIAETANTAPSAASGMAAALDLIGSHCQWPIGHYCSVVTDHIEHTRSVVSTEIWHLSDDVADPVAARCDAARLSQELGLSDRVLASREPVWIGGATPTMFGLPIMAGTDVVAVLEFFGLGIAPESSRIALLTRAGMQLARMIEREHEREHSTDAFHDSLTRLPNRALFLQFVGRALKRKERDDACQFAILFIDLDGFKTINDSLGHGAGDQLLLQIGTRLAQTIRSTDMLGRFRGADGSEDHVARLGGDEFTVLLEDVAEVRDAMRVSDRIHRALSSPFTIDSGVEVYASASIGIAWSRGGHRSPEEVLQDADIAMYRAKANGKGRSEIFDEDMHQKAIARLQLETDLRRAVPRSELSLAYQPIVRLDTATVVGFEALARWHHPTRGVVSPSTFISIAEDRGMILEIGAWVLREACRQLRAWQLAAKRPDLTMAVNLSARQFSQVDLVDQVAQAIWEEAIEARCLTLELTETIAMGTPRESRQQLAALRRLGVNVAIDDFGTGHSSLSYLGQFRVTTLKIDRSFIRQLSDDHGETLVRAVLSLGNHLGLQVIAEGVETDRESQHLQQLGCVYAQGFHFYQPLSADAAASVLIP
jgi:diguanylate cyclase (GGDEF)-like protein